MCAFPDASSFLVPKSLILDPLLPLYPQLFHLPPTFSSQLPELLHCPTLALHSITLHLGPYHPRISCSIGAAAPLRLAFGFDSVKLLLGGQRQPDGRAGAHVRPHGVPGRTEGTDEVHGEDHEVVHEERKGQDGGGADAWVGEIHLGPLRALGQETRDGIARRRKAGG